MRYIKFLILVLTIGGCTSSESDEGVPRSTAFSLIALSVEDLEASSSWYMENLGFTHDTTMAFPDYGLKMSYLKLDNFKLELIQFDDPKVITEDQLPTEYSNIHGIIKIGFLTDKMDALVANANASEAEVVAGPSDLPALNSGGPWPKKFFLLKDPDGNFVQFFSEMEAASSNFSGEYALSPFLAMISVKDFERSVAWYERKGFEQVERLESPGNQRGIWSAGNFYLEIGSFEDDTNLEDLGVTEEERDRVVRFNKLGMSVNYADSLYAKLLQDQYPFFYDHMTDDEPGFIIEDNARNYVQYLKE